MAATTQTLQDTGRVAVMKFHNDTLTTDETTVLKVDVSTLAADPVHGQACTGVAIEEIKWVCSSGLQVDIIWDATANLTAYTVSGEGCHKFCDHPIVNQTGAGKTGDILFTTVGGTATGRYSIVMRLRKTFG